MMRHMRYFALGLALVFACSGYRAKADTYTLTGVGSNIYQGVYIGPYTAQLTGGGTLPVICDDFNTPVSKGQSWNASVVTFATPNFLSQLKFGNRPNALNSYLAAAYLAQQIMLNLSNTTKVDELSFALWGIFSTTAYGKMDAQSKIYFDQAFQNHGSIGDFANVAFLIPNPASSFQEYITIVPTPEPTAWVLLACGALLFVFLKTKLL